MFSLGLRGTALGNRWAKALLDDKTLAERYKQTKAEGQLAQKKFRAIWCQGLWNDAKRRRVMTQSRGDRTVSSKDFAPIGVWVMKEGGYYEAARGVQKFIQKVTERGLHGKYFRVHEWTERMEIAIPKTKITEYMGNDWNVKTDEEQNTPGDPPQVAARGV